MEDLKTFALILGIITGIMAAIRYSYKGYRWYQEYKGKSANQEMDPVPSSDTGNTTAVEVEKYPSVRESKSDQPASPVGTEVDTSRLNGNQLAESGETNSLDNVADNQSGVNQTQISGKSHSKSLKKKHKENYKYWKKRLNNEGDNPQVMVETAEAMLKIGKTEQAKELLQKADHYPNSHELREKIRRLQHNSH